MAMSITGIVSGIDWDSMVTELIENAQKPALIQLEKRDKLELKKTLWEEIQVGLSSLQSALSSLKLASTFTAKDVEIERLDRNTSYKGVLTATVNADAEINVHDLEVVQLATKQVSRSDKFTTAGVNSYFYVSAGGSKVRIDVAATDTPEALAEKVNTQLKTQVPPVSVTAAVVDGKLILSSDSTGLGQTTYTAEITRSVNAYDTVFFSSNPSNTDSNVEPPTFTIDMELGGINSGTITLKGSDGTIYEVGKDFDVINGNQIRWRRYDPLTPPPGAVYQDTYTAYVGDTYVVTAQRSPDGDTDAGVFPFSAISSNIAITSDGGTVSYTQGTDFQVGVDGSIHWLGIKRPADGADYEVTYVAAGGETFTFDITRSNQDVLSGGVTYADLTEGSVTIQQSGRLWREGFDFGIVQNSNGDPVVQWYPGGGGDSPEPGSAYNLVLQKSDGTQISVAGTRSTGDEVSLPNNGKLTTLPQGTHSVTYNGQSFSVGEFNPTLDVSGTKLLVDWATPSASLAAHTKVPAYDGTYTVTYTYNANTFYLSDDGSGTLTALGLDNMDEDHYTTAKDAVLIVDGETVTRSSNTIGEGYGNELIKGMTLQLKGVGQVSLDVSQNAEAAVTALDNFVTAYNEVLDWINVRITEEAVDEATAATLESDDYRLKWGLLRGNSLLRGMKNSLRLLTSRIYSAAFAQRTSRSAIYGTMSQNGIVNAGAFTVTAGGRTATIPVTPEDTLDTIAAKINSSQIDGLNNPLYYDAAGEAYSAPLAKAAVENGKLTISGSNGDATLGGSTAILSALGLNYKYTALSQIGIKLASTGEMSDQGKSGELDFDSGAFMAALEDSPGDVSALVTNFAGQMQTYLDNMIKSSTKEVAAGVTTAQGAVAREMNAIDAEIASIDSYLDKFEERLLAKQESLQAQFAAAEVSLSAMMQQAAWLESVTAQLQSTSASTN
ncbi:MAG: flagellar filament capping protein FliD [Synergistaceae bacterium]|jgi:flagellar hook-associated protein 2|nr:flagellar filament capping protein FliD [Synergistaceae bacterium]